MRQRCAHVCICTLMRWRCSLFLFEAELIEAPPGVAARLKLGCDLTAVCWRQHRVRMRRIDLRALALLTCCGLLAELVEALEGLAIGRILLALDTKHTRLRLRRHRFVGESRQRDRDTAKSQTGSPPASRHVESVAASTNAALEPQSTQATCSPK